MKKLFFIFCFAVLSLLLNAQVKTLNRLGQTPGSAGFHVNYDSLNQQLIVGCGTSVWVYDTHDTGNIHVIAKRPLLGLVNETDLYGNVLFVAASHDGVFALDYTSDSLDILAHYDMQGLKDTAAYDMWRTNDTLFIADNHQIRMLKYIPGTGFIKLGSFGGPYAFCVARRNNQIAVGCQGLLSGTINVYNLSDLTTPVAFWSSSQIFAVQDLQFADLRNDIIYICGGPSDMLFTESRLFALQLSGNTLTPVDTFKVTGGILGYAQMNIMNMDSRNDTLYVVTTAAYDANTLPLAYMPIIDATGLPNDTMKKIGYVIPGLWHFDCALMDGTPYIAMSSEWCGFLISDISQLQPDDSLHLYETGGWCLGSKIRHDTLWAFHEGYGLVAYKRDSLYYHNGYMTDSKILHIYRQFISDFDFINDTLIVLSSSFGDIYNLKPWLSGGGPVKVDSLGIGNNGQLKIINTNVGQRLICGWYNILAPPEAILLVNPAEPAHPRTTLDSVQTRTNLFSMCVKNDTLYCGIKNTNKFYLAAYKVANDQLILVDTMNVPGEVTCIAVENGIVAIGSNMNLKWYSLSGGTFTLLGSFFDWFINPQGLYLKNKFLYVADKFYGLKVFDLSAVSSATLVAQCMGTGGWKNLYGSGRVDVGPDGLIYLSDFHAGIIIIEPYDTTLAGITEYQTADMNHKIFIYPNPAADYFVLKSDDGLDLSGATIKVINSSGNKIMEAKISSSNETMVYSRNLAPGLYFIEISRNNSMIAVGKIIIQ